LTYDATKTDVLKDSIKESQKNGFKILPPDVNSSNIHFTPVSENEIRFGLNEIKGVGEEPAKNIIEHRGYESIIDFIIKTLGTKVNKRITLALIGGGAFDNLIPEGERRKYLKITEEFYINKKTSKNPEKLREVWNETVENHELDSKTTPEEYMEMEKNYLSGSFFHGVFSDDMVAKIEKLKSLNKCLRDFNEIREADKSSAYVFVHVKDLRCHKQKNGKLMCFITAEDCNGEELTIPCFASYYEHIKEKLLTGFYLMKVYPDDNGGILFGSRNWVTSPDTIRAMLVRYQPRSN
jgi:DNA polymerase III alpha subunit